MTRTPVWGVPLKGRSWNNLRARDFAVPKPLAGTQPSGGSSTAWVHQKAHPRSEFHFSTNPALVALRGPNVDPSWRTRGFVFSAGQT